MDDGRVAAPPGLWQAFGSGADADAAWDDAKDTALVAWGQRFTASDCYVEDFCAERVPVPSDAAARAVSPRAGLCMRAVADPRDWATRRARAVLTDTALVLPDWSVGDEPLVLAAEPVLDAALCAALAAGGKPLGPDEQLGRVALVGLRRRTKVVVERFPAPSARRHIVCVGSTIVSDHATSTAARAAAKEAAGRSGAAEVWVLAGRAGDLPLLRARTQLVAQRATLAGQVVRPRRPDRTRVAGWLVSGPVDGVGADPR